jgi:hypothetical protein
MQKMHRYFSESVQHDLMRAYADSRLLEYAWRHFGLCRGNRNLVPAVMAHGQRNDSIHRDHTFIMPISELCLC